jgi:hypothetical protein
MDTYSKTAAQYRKTLELTLRQIGCWPMNESCRPKMSRIMMRREISKQVKKLDDDELLAVMWIVNSFAVSKNT